MRAVIPILIISSLLCGCYEGKKHVKDNTVISIDLAANPNEPGFAKPEHKTIMVPTEKDVCPDGMTLGRWSAGVEQKAVDAGPTWSMDGGHTWNYSGQICVRVPK